MLISYCITCMGRLWQLRETLEEHLRVFKDRKDVEFILLDYNSPDGLERWIGENTAAGFAIDSGLLVYVKEHTAQRYDCSKAKNLAHRFARGDVLVNLDGDNWAASIDPAVRQAFATSSDVIFHAYNQNYDGSYGRIGLSRNWFYRLGGYDEAFEPMGFQDADLLIRATAIGLERIVFVCGRPPIHNDAWHKVAFTGIRKWQEMWESNKAISRGKLIRGDMIGNLNGWGSAIVSINFGEKFQLAPIKPSAAPLEMRFPLGTQVTPEFFATLLTVVNGERIRSMPAVEALESVSPHDPKCVPRQGRTPMFIVRDRGSD